MEQCLSGSELLVRGPDVFGCCNGFGCCRDVVFERLCVQILQRTRPMAGGQRWQEELEASRRRARGGVAPWSESALG